MTGVLLWISAQDANGIVYLDTYLITDNGWLSGAVPERDDSPHGRGEISDRRCDRPWKKQRGHLGQRRYTAIESTGTRAIAGGDSMAVRLAINSSAATPPVPEPKMFTMVGEVLLAPGLRFRK